MTLIQFVRLFKRYLWIMVLAAIILGSVVYTITPEGVKTYSSEATINTGLVSGFTISRLKGGRIDYAFTNTEFENLITLATSFETNEELAARLLAKYLMIRELDTLLMQEENFEAFQELISEETKRKVVDYSSEERTYQKIVAFRDQKGSNELYDLFHSDHRFFGIEQLESIGVSRYGKSDLIYFSYTTEDPGVCQQTLYLIMKIVIKRHRENKEAQSSDVVSFFEEQTKNSASKLRSIEDELLKFRVNNKIINYYEQTRFISAKKEDLDERYYIELMAMASADSTLQMLERQLETRVNLKEINNKLAVKRAELVEISTNLAKNEIASLDTTAVDPNKILEWRARSEAIKAEMEKEASNILAVTRTPGGVEVKNLLTEWLSYSITLEQAQTRLNIMSERKREFEEIYQRYAPWGSKLKRIEREIDVSERAYLENLHSYNQALMHQYNLIMSSNLKIEDDPYFPTNDSSSGKGLMAIVGGLAGFVLTLGAGVALEFMDNTLRHVVHASDVIGLEVIGAFPKLPRKLGRSRKIDLYGVKEMATNQIIQNLRLSIKAKTKLHLPANIIMLSTRACEGKTYLAAIYAQELREQGYTVLFLYPDNQEEHKHRNASFIDFDHEDNVTYSCNKTFLKISNFSELLADGKKSSDYDVIFLELPGILANQFPVDLLNNVDLTLLVARANRNWINADKKALEVYCDAVNHAPKLLLNGVKMDFLEYSLGDLPRRRNFLRRILKKIVRMEIKGGQSI